MRNQEGKPTQTLGDRANGTWKNRETLHTGELNPSSSEAIVPVITFPCQPYITLPWHEMKSYQDTVSIVCSSISPFIVYIFAQGLGPGGARCVTVPK